ncbi:hypothetical protein N0B51_12700 [Tsuneonella sp. YG55]|uniref:Uncharacterized protein n=1 Tax=Tsuneonella litorea TaxID=2976475 RepID=A0A9X2W2W6_9SPHN|nr:hypothetical protein [Tsuneonella litorea]MCT2559836.1 hypothetical protein [Tsuneonella litorea]
MKTCTKPLRTGLAAIAAATALSSSLAVAQTASQATTGPIVLPESSLPVPDPVPASQPTIVVPEVAPVTAAEEPPAPLPVTATARTTRTTAPAPASDVSRTVPRPMRATSRKDVDPGLAPVAAAATNGPQELASVSGDATEVAARDIAAQSIDDEVRPAPEMESQREDVTEGLAQLLAGLLVAAIAAGGLVLLMRRRRAIVRADEAPAIQRPIVREPVDHPAPTGAAVTAARPTGPQPAMERQGYLPSQGAAIALPREAPTDFEERTSLLRRMVAARPDRANPFRSPGARLKRARLILASLGRKFESGPPRIDLSDYTSNWPALARYNRTAPA